MSRRIFGLETEFGLTYNSPQREISPEEAARYLFRKVVAWGRSSNVFLSNGSRLYLDVGSHPEYATAECDDIRTLLIHDKAGEVILGELAADASQKLHADGIPGEIHLFKNNLDSAGNSYGCHENYLLRRRADFSRTTTSLIGFLITRQILTGAGHILTGEDGVSRYTFSQRADHMWEATSTATTRSRPIINTRDEPHANPDKYRRLHVISGDSSMSHPSTMLKVGMTDIIIRMLEAGAHLADLEIADPIAAIRIISHDLSGTAPFELSSGLKTTAVGAQEAYLSRARQFIDQHGANTHDEWVLDLWQRGVDAVRSGDHSGIETELDWAIKKRLIDRYREGKDIPLDDARVRRLDLAYHDVASGGIFSKLMERGLAQRLVTDEEIVAATSTAPQTTRAKLRGDFVTAANAARRDYTVDWVHLKLNDHAGRTVLCTDPFASSDSRVDELIALMEAGA